MNFAAFLGRHGRTAVLLAVALAIAGAIAAGSLPVGLFPQVSFPRIVVDLDAGSRPADQTALLVTRPVEDAVRRVAGVQTVRSGTTRGSAQISIDFGWGRDMVASTLLVDSAIAQVLPSLPAGTAYTVRRMDPTVFPIISYALVSDSASQVAMRDLAQYQIVPRLAAIAGLAHVDVQGGDTSEVEVEADPRRLSLYGLAMPDLAAALAASNVLASVGRMHDRGKLFLVVASRSLAGVNDVANTVLRADAHGLVRVRDVAHVTDGTVLQWQRVVEDGKPAVLINVYEQPDGNAVRVAGAVQAKLAALELPAGMRLVNWYDQSELVLQSAASVRDAVGIGLVLAGIVLLVFLRNWRLTAIALVIVPATLAIAVLLLTFFGMSFNIMTLGGIAAAVGLLIDDVIVMVEHIARRAGMADAHGAPAGRAAVLPAAAEFLQPLTGSSLATIIVFLPLAFQSGVSGAFSKALAITMAAALAVSYLMSALVVPVLAGRFIDFTTWRDPGAAAPGRFARGHAAILAWLFSHPAMLAAGLVPIVVIGWFAYGTVPTGFMPAVDEGGFVLDYYTPPGTSLEETSREIAQVDALLSATPEVATFSRRLGTLLGGDLGESYHGDYFVRLRPDHARATPNVMAATRAAIDAAVPGVDVDLAQLMEDLIGDLTAVPQPIEIKLFADDPRKIIPVAERIAGAIGKIDGVVEIKSGVVLAGDAVDVRIDPVRTQQEGATPDDVTQAVNAALSGVVATQIAQATKTVGVRVRLPRASDLNLEDLARLEVRAPDGHLFPLQRVARLVRVVGQPQIARENLAPMLAVTARIEGRGLGAVVDDVRRLIEKPGMLPSGIRYELGGLYAQQQIAFAGLARVFAAALAAEILLLLVLYRSIALAGVIIVCSLLSTTAVFTGLWLSGVALNITALMGMTMVIGIGTEMAIFFVSEYVELAQHLPGREALIGASSNRLRPITMTTLAAILTLLPLALAIGQGSGIQQPLAIAIIAGLLLQYPLVLLAMPVLISLVSAKPKRVTGGLGGMAHPPQV